MNHLHGVWLYACGHEAFRCKCLAPGELHHRTDLCGECRGRLTHSAPAEPFPPATERTEPFPLATD